MMAATLLTFLVSYLVCFPAEPNWLRNDRSGPPFDAQLRSGQPLDTYNYRAERTTADYDKLPVTT